MPDTQSVWRAGMNTAEHENIELGAVLQIQDILRGSRLTRQARWAAINQGFVIDTLGYGALQDSASKLRTLPFR